MTPRTNIPNRIPDDFAHRCAEGPLDRVDWPTVDDVVVYRTPMGVRVPAIVRAVDPRGGDLRLYVGADVDLVDVGHGPQPGGWLLYREVVWHDTASPSNRAQP